MSKKTYVRDDSGKVTAIRYTSGDGRRSRLHEAKSDFFGYHSGKCIEIADHHPNGTTRAYDGGEDFFGYYKGKEKK